MCAIVNNFLGGLSYTNRIRVELRRRVGAAWHRDFPRVAFEAGEPPTHLPQSYQGRWRCLSIRAETGAAAQLQLLGKVSCYLAAIAEIIIGWLWGHASTVPWGLKFKVIKMFLV